MIFIMLINIIYFAEYLMGYNFPDVFNGNKRCSHIVHNVVKMIIEGIIWWEKRVNGNDEFEKKLIISSNCPQFNNSS